MNLGDRIDGLVRSFHAAALGREDWLRPLAGMAELTSASSGELIAIGPDGDLPIHLLSNIDPGAAAEFEALDGRDPAVNARIRAGLVAPELAVIGEPDFASEHDMRSPLYDLYRRIDIVFSIQTTLVRQNDLVIGLAAMRSEARGALGAEESAVFAAIAPHVQAAVRTRLALEDQGAALMAGAVDAVSLPILICDRSGRVRSLSPGVEPVLRGGGYISLSNGALRTYVPAESEDLNRRIRQAARAGAASPPPPRFMTLTGRRGLPPLVVEVAPIPAIGCPPMFGLGAMVIVRQPQARAEQAASLARALFGLTPSEAAIAGDLVTGLSAEQISDARRITVGTVRTHIRRILAKAGVGRQIEFAGLISARL